MSDILEFKSISAFKLNNIGKVLSLFSPIILIFGILIHSILSSTLQGVVCIVYLLFSFTLRNYIHYIQDTGTENTPVNFCNSMIYTLYSNNTFSSYMFAFLITYIFFPMMKVGKMNFYLFLLFLFYAFVDLSIRQSNNCFPSSITLMKDIGIGILLASITVLWMIEIGAGKYLYYKETSSTKEMCHQPDKQTFKCAVYKNGELIGDV